MDCMLRGSHDMVTVKQKTRIRKPRETWRDAIPGVHIATEREGLALYLRLFYVAVPTLMEQAAH